MTPNYQGSLVDDPLRPQVDLPPALGRPLGKVKKRFFFEREALFRKMVAAVIFTCKPACNPACTPRKNANLQETLQNSSGNATKGLQSIGYAHILCIGKLHFDVKKWVLKIVQSIPVVTIVLE